MVPEITAVSSVVDRIRKRIEEGTSNSERAQKLQKSTGRGDEQDIYVQQHGCKRDGVDAALAQFCEVKRIRLWSKGPASKGIIVVG